MVDKERSAEVLARNIAALLDGKGIRSRNEFVRTMKSRYGIVQHTFNDMATAGGPDRPSYSPRLANVDRVAHAFGLCTWELLDPKLADRLKSHTKSNGPSVLRVAERLIKYGKK